MNSCCNCGVELKGKKKKKIKVTTDDETYFICKYCQHVPSYNTDNFIGTISLMLHELEKTIKENK